MGDFKLKPAGQNMNGAGKRPMGAGTYPDFQTVW
jgi:hypothetical protein